jgi:DNA gyrase subunit A
MYRVTLKPGGLLGNPENIDEWDIGEFDEHYMAIQGINRNLQRNIPLFFDNLKVVHRRILFAMAQMGLWPNKPYVKCAGVIGRVIEKYHPHGDSAAYEALIFMRQPWRILMPLMDIRGNYGNAENSSEYAQMRYVEVRLSKFAQDCFFSEWDLKSDLVDKRPSFNGVDVEPIYLPAKYPLFLMNWGSGMGFGLATSSPGFLPQEAMQAVIDLVKDENANIVLYPEDPSGCTIYGKKVFKKFVDFNFDNKEKEGLKFKVRSNYVVDKEGIIKVLNTPFEVNPTTVIEKIKELVNTGKLDGIINIEVKLKSGAIPQLGTKSDAIEMIIEYKKGFDPHILMDRLYKLTDLEYGFALNCVYVNGNGNIKFNLRDSILEWIKLRKKLIKRMKRLGLNDAAKRIYVLVALIDMFEKDRIDEVIQIIKKNKRSEVPEILVKRFEVSDYQAKNIGKMELFDLSQESYHDYIDEREKLKIKLVEDQKFLKDKDALDNMIIDQMKEGIKKYFRPRQSKILELQNDADQEFYNIEVTDTGFIRKADPDKELQPIPESMNTKLISRFLSISDLNKLFIFTDQGLVYSEAIKKIRTLGDQGLGDNIARKVKGNIPPLNIVSVANGKENTTSTLLFVTRNGLIKTTKFDSYFVSSQGSIGIKLVKDDKLVKVIEVPEKTKYRAMIYTKLGKAVIFDIAEITQTSRTTIGSTGIKLMDNDEVIDMEIIKATDDYLISVTANGDIKKFSIDNTFSGMKRGSLGVSVIQSGEILSRLIAISPKVKEVVLESYEYVETINVDECKAKTRISNGDKVLRARRSFYEVITKKEK